ncbi:MAG: D-alanyl-D-alanine carboxypeptidase [Lachnospiraceae bacterium]|nr:D-alanyl-D-alanine carboxypeptidase [Lachnospiraceae bacterium]
MMGRSIKKAVILLLTFLLILGTAEGPLALAKNKKQWPEEVTLSAPKEAAVVMDMDSMAVLYGKHMLKKHYPASITKVMTALVAIENGSLKDTVKFSRDAVYNIERDSAHIARDVGEKMSLKNCLYGMMLESANECANAIAEHVGGDYDTFIRMMNKKAKALGCQNTHFVNPHGLHNDKHYTCAYDMALIAREAYQNKTFRKIVGTATYTIPPTNLHAEGTLLTNHHAMLHVYRTSKYLYEYCVGGKTGYTTQAMNTLVTYAKKGDQKLVCIIMNAGQYMHYNDTRALLDYSFAHFHTVPITGEDAPKESASAGGAYDLQFDASDIEICDGYYATLPKGVKLEDASWRAIGAEEDIYPKEAEDTSGHEISGAIEYTWLEHRVGSVPFYFDTPALLEKKEGSETAMASPAFQKAWRIARYVLIAVILLILAVILRYLYVEAPYNQYYGSKFLKRHFNRKRRKRLAKVRKMREERWR